MLYEVSETHRKQALEAAIRSMDSRFGVGTLMRLGDRPAIEVDALSSGSLSVDKALGIGGYPRGRVVEVFGPEASGKTTLALHAIAEAQRAGGTAAFIDAEHALDVGYAGALGVDVEQLLVAQPDTGEQALEVAETLVRSGAVDLVVVDSVAALVPKAEIEGDMGDQHMGLQARLMSQALRKLTGIVNRSGCILLFINQVRHKIGVVFGNGEVTTGGNALKFYASVRLEVRRIGALKEAGEIVGNRTRVKVVKNKVAAPFQSVEVDILYGRGICRAGEVIEAALAAGVLSKSGNWYVLGERKIANGKEKTRRAVQMDEELMAELHSLLMAAMTDVAPEAK